MSVEIYRTFLATVDGNVSGIPHATNKLKRKTFLSFFLFFVNGHRCRGIGKIVTTTTSICNMSVNINIEYIF